MRNKIISMLLGVVVLCSGSNVFASIVFPALELNPVSVTGNSSGLTMTGSAPYTLSAPSTVLVDFIPDLTFSLTSDATGNGTLSVTGAETLSASFTNLSITHIFAGTADWNADLTYIGGTLASLLGGTGGRVEGGFSGLGSSFAPGADLLGQNFSTSGGIAKIGAVPVPAAVWLFGSGLLGLAGIARRKAAV